MRSETEHDLRVHALVQVLLDESTCLDAFIEAMEAQDEALLAGRYHELPALTQRHGTLLDRLAGLDRQRESALLALGLACGDAGAAQAGRRWPRVEAGWTAVLQRAQRARSVAFRVQAKVNMNRAFAADALAFLQARCAPVYGPDGSRQQRAGRNSLAVG